MNTLFGWMGSKQTCHKIQARLNNPSSDMLSIHLNNAAVALKNPQVRSQKTENGFIAIVGDVQLKKAQPSSQATLSTILENYIRLGPLSINQLQGHFLILIILDKRQEVFIAQDKLGTFPFFYARNQQGLFFGNYLQAFHRQLDLTNQLSLDAIYHYLYYHSIPSPLCIYKSFSRLLPGHYLIYQNDRLKSLPYWHPTLLNKPQGNFSQKKEQLHNLVSSAIQKRSIGKLGAFLSGGIDSTSVLGFATKVAGRPIDAFTIGFDAENYDEVAYAKIAADKYEANHHIYYLQAKDIITCFDTVQSGLAQPFGNASLIPSYYCAKMAKNHQIDSLFAGDGGDELFGGNSRYAKQILLSHYHSIPKFIRKNIIEPSSKFLSPLDNLSYVHKALSYIQQANMPMPERMESYNLLNRIGIQNILTSDTLKDINCHAPLQLLSHHYTQTDAQTTLGRMLATDLKFTLTDSDLVKVRTACSIAGIDVHFPLLDDKLMMFALNLPDRDKVKGQNLRAFYKKAMSHIIPPQIVDKSKHGFGLPYGLWMLENQALKDFSFDHLQLLKRRNWIQNEFIDQLFNKYLVEHPNYYGVMSWVLIMLEGWLQKHQSTQASNQFQLLTMADMPKTDLV
tara:strand:+ start:12644 stop:14506 length:1863 start_codon:yes stop_codon:yes gene_type:complete